MVRVRLSDSQLLLDLRKLPGGEVTGILLQRLEGPGLSDKTGESGLWLMPQAGGACLAGN